MRWYDEYPGLKKHLEKIKHMDSHERKIVLQKIMSFINDSEYAHVINEKAMAFPLKPSVRRWYDRDPYLWLIVNGLKHTDKDFIDNIFNHLEQQLSIA
jgi:hypothetical protein